MRAGKHGDLTRFPALVRVFHIDLIAPVVTGGLDTLRNLAGRPKREVLREAARWSQRTLRHTSYSTVVAVTDRGYDDRRIKLPAWPASHYEELLEDANFIYSRILIFPFEIELREFLDKRDDVRAYYDSDFARRCRIGVHAREFPGWDGLD